MAATFTAAAATSACLNFSPFACQDDTQCDAEPLGRCELGVGYCSYPDVACLETGYRYEPDAGDGLGGECVIPGGVGTGSTTTEADTEPVLDSGESTMGPQTGPDTGETATDDATTTGDCGGAGQECCTGNECDPGLACSEGVCGCVSAVAVGDRHSCAIKLDGSVWCWGANDLGQLAVAAPEMSSTPIQVMGFGPGSEATVLAARNHTCAIHGTTAACWGDNTDQKVDFGAAIPFVTTPSEAVWATPATHVGAGGTHTCVSRGADLPVICWGSNASGQLSGAGGPDPQMATIPPGLEPSAIALGQSHTCVSALTGELLCWGDNASGQLGLDPATTPMSSETNVIAIPPIGSVVAGFEHTCARAGSDVLCWGRNDQGQVGDGTGVSTFTPTIVTFPPGTAAVTSVVAAADQTCAIVAPGDVWCWGGNSNGELLLPGDKMGNDAFALSPREIDLDFDVAQLATGVTHTCALSTTGQVLCWGVNGDGQIGDGTTADALDPTPVQLGCP
ncbi:MAG: hypothetical protein H6712_10395 [Myxococcales bacterium]|nr:hypothetical protein [Myxococcales bacterium]MCB9714257.1 hypothetical protein [Myxococcales bacterium]